MGKSIFGAGSRHGDTTPRACSQAYGFCMLLQFILIFHGIESLILVTAGHHEAVKILCTDDVPYQNLLTSGLSQPPSEELLLLEPVSPPTLDLRTTHTFRWVGLDSEQGARVEKEARIPYGRTTRNT